MKIRTFLLSFLFTTLITPYSRSQDNIVELKVNERHQVIDGFGAFQGGDLVNENWWQELFYEDMHASIFRVDLTPQLKSPYADLNVYSPWFMGSSVDSPFNIEDTDNPNGPENNRVRTYTSPEDYSRSFGGMNAPIAVMGPDINANIQHFTYKTNAAISVGFARKDSLGDFKLIGSIWSPLPWVKISSGNNYEENWWPGPVKDSPWPFIWGGNYAGGMLDVSGNLLDVFDDSALGGEGPTSSLTQFARSTAAYIKGYQDFHQAKFYAISIQNELNFEEFYNSMTYPHTNQYIAALKAIRAEFDKYDDLKDIRIMGPEDLLGSNAYALWQYGTGETTIHKNLQYLRNINNNEAAKNAIDFFCIHGYDIDGASAVDPNPIAWRWWKNGWTESPAAGIPSNIKGYTAYGKKSWMTETSGEISAWLHPTTAYPSQGAWSIAVRIHQALTVGDQSAWIYWSFVDVDENDNIKIEGMTSQSLGSNAPKYVAAKHFFRYIRPNAVRVSCNSLNANSIFSSAYVKQVDGTYNITIVLINALAEEQELMLKQEDLVQANYEMEAFTSSDNNFWEASKIQVENKKASITLPPYSVMTLVGNNNFTTAVKNVKDKGKASLLIYPNPSNNKIAISFELSQKEKMNLSIYDEQGKLVKNILNQIKPLGKHQVELDTRDLSNGIYIVKLETELVMGTKKLVVSK